MSVEERLDLEREDHHHESTQARLGGRGKSAYCRQCKSNFRMQSVHRETLAKMTDAEIEALGPWYRCPESLTDEYLYYPCPACNWPVVITNDFASVPIDEVLGKWRTDCGLPNWGEDPREMKPDYAALAAEPEAVTAGQDSRDSAGLEG